jgi:hypothetical protein
VQQEESCCNAVTWTFNPKVPGSRPERPTKSDVLFRVNPFLFSRSRQVFRGRSPIPCPPICAQAQEVAQCSGSSARWNSVLTPSWPSSEKGCETGHRGAAWTKEPERVIEVDGTFGDVAFFDELAAHSAQLVGLAERPPHCEHHLDANVLFLSER